MDYFSSVRFALFIISLLIVASVIGTIIPQGQPLVFYIKNYGQANAVIMEILGISNMYSSVWFNSLLFLLCLNLVVCSLDRIPQVIKFVKKDNLNVNITKLMQSNDRVLFSSNTDKETAETAVYAVLEQKKWKIQSRHNADFLMFFAEKSAWSRLGAYFVHMSILVIFLGALLGNTFGFKGFVMVPEGGTATEITQHNDEQTKIPLPFTLRCDAFAIEYYNNGMPKVYRSDLVILEKGKEVVNKQITVNNPLNFSGLTFYQSSYQPIPDQYTVELTQKSQSQETNQNSWNKQSFYVESRTKQVWKDKKVNFEIVETGADGHGHGPYKIWFDDEAGEPTQFFVDDKKPLTVVRGVESYEITIKQRYATGLQVVKDPGVWLVYIGFGLMLFGLYVSFFMSHRRLWISIQKTGTALTIILSGSSNKNQTGLSKTVEDLATTLLNEKSLELRRI